MVPSTTAEAPNEATSSDRSVWPSIECSTPKCESESTDMPLNTDTHAPNVLLRDGTAPATAPGAAADDAPTAEFITLLIFATYRLHLPFSMLSATATVVLVAAAAEVAICDGVASVVA